MMRKVVWALVGLLVAAILFPQPAASLELITLKVREVRRVPDGRDVLLVYEVQNGLVDRVRLVGADLEFRDRWGQRADLVPLSTPSLLRPDEAIFLRGHVEAGLLKGAAEVRLVLRAQRDFPFPVLEASRPPEVLEFRFPGGEAPSSPPKQRPTVLHLRLAGVAASTERPGLLILYALRNEGPTDLHRVLLDLRYEGEGALLEAQTLPVGAGILRAGEEAFVQAWLSRQRARQVDRLVTRAILYATTHAEALIIPLKLEAGEPGAFRTSPPPEPDENESPEAFPRPKVRPTTLIQEGVER